MATIEQVLADLGIVDDTVSINTQEDMLSGKARMPVAIPTDVSRESEGGDSEQEWNEFCQDGDRYDPQDYPLNPEDVTNAEYTAFHDAQSVQRRIYDIVNAIMTDPHRFMRWCGQDRQTTSSDELLAAARAGHAICLIPYGNRDLNEYCCVSVAALEEARHANPDHLDDLYYIGNRAFEWHQLIHGFMGCNISELETSLFMLDIEYELYYEEDQCMCMLKGTKYLWCLYVPQVDAYDSSHIVLYTMIQCLLF